MACNITPPISRNRNGHIIALEGPSELVSTQLRLLPSSSHILTLPSLQHYIGQTDQESLFDACELIRAYHQAAQTRHAEALDFLRPSTASNNQKRLVFMHGGTVSAQAACLEAIMEHESEGDIEVADATYCRLVSNGVAGLSAGKRLSRGGSGKRVSFPPHPVSVQREAGSPVLSKARESRPSVLDSVGCIGDEDDTMGNRIMRAMRAADALDKETEFLQPDGNDLDYTVKLIDIPSRTSKRLSSQNVEAAEARLASTRRASCDAPPVSPFQKASAGDRSPDTSNKPNLKIRIPSPPIPWAGDVANKRFSANLTQTYPPRESSLPKRPRTAGDELSPRQKPTGSWGIQRDEAFSPADWAPPLQPAPQEQKTEQIQTNPEEPSGDETDDQPREEVLPLLEDLVLLFSNETPDQLQDSVFRRLSTSDPMPTTNGDQQQQQQHPSAAGNGPEKDDGQTTSRRGSQWTQRHLVHGLPTPGHSPSPLDTAAVDMRLYSLSVDQETAVSIQNFLRSFLATQFPLQDHGGFRRSISGEDGLWKPLECDGEHLGPDGGRRLDLILAVGAESRVKKSRLAEVVGQLEKLGFKASGLSRSGRLDLRYLIANAMQAFTAQPLTKQTQTNPFVDRSLLAALILPHLETYMATHPNVRFLLIEYPSEHLPTVLALQTLIGTEMMKIVGIVNGDGSSLARRPSAPSESESERSLDRRPSEGFLSMNPQSSQMPGALMGSCSFSKANFLLASQATGFETAAFVAAIRESLISISDFYIPERPLYKQPASQSSRGSRPSYPPLSVSLKPSPVSSISPNDSRVSTSTLIITPPSSPADSFPTALRHPPQGHFSPSSPTPQTHTRPVTSPTANTGVTTGPRFPTRIPPRTSSITSPASPSSSPPPPPPPRNNGIRWGTVNYGPPAAPSAILPPPTPPAGIPVPPVPDTIRELSSPMINNDIAAAMPTAGEPYSEKPADHGNNTAAAATAVHTFAYVNNNNNNNNTNKNNNNGGSYYYHDADDDEEDEDEDEDERRLMPMTYHHLRRRHDSDRLSKNKYGTVNGNGVKALKWLGLV